MRSSSTAINLPVSNVHISSIRHSDIEIAVRNKARVSEPQTVRYDQSKGANVIRTWRTEDSSSVRSVRKHVARNREQSQKSEFTNSRIPNSKHNVSFFPKVAQRQSANEGGAFIAIEKLGIRVAR